MQAALRVSPLPFTTEPSACPSYLGWKVAALGLGRAMGMTFSGTPFWPFIWEHLQAVLFLCLLDGTTKRSTEAWGLLGCHTDVSRSFIVRDIQGKRYSIPLY